MFGTTQTPTAATPTDLIIEGSEKTFLQDVIDPSKTIPVIVDFWAPWCGPCKTLGPALEAAVTAAKGRVKMVKINVDQNQALAAQLRIQSIPTVYAFFNGQPVDGFQGAVAPSEIKRFVESVIALGPEPDNGLADAIEAAETMLTDGEFNDAVETFTAILEEEPENVLAYAGLIRAHLGLGNLDLAETLITTAPGALAKAKEIEATRAMLDLARQAASAGPEADLQAAHEKDPKNPQILFDLATALYANGKIEQAVSTLLDLFKLDRDWNNNAARTQLFTIFDALKPQDPIVLAGRRRLSSMIFV
jgi:putative thioredoxin